MDRSKKTRLGTPPPELLRQSRRTFDDAVSMEEEVTLRAGVPAPPGEALDTSAPTMTPDPGAYAAPAADSRLDLGANVPAAGQKLYPAPPDPYIGKVIAGRYRIQKKLGEGGMGTVYLATHVTLEKQVALKVLHREYARKRDLVERFLQEAKAASAIRHENVIDITDFGTTPEGAVFFAMEVLEGKDLHEVVTRAKLEGRVLPWQRSKAIFRQICAALTAAHNKGIIHRDLKPENIYLVNWLGHTDFVKLLDFGIAKLTEVSDNDRKLTRTGMLFGTPDYMSPEQARGDKVDHRVDIYAMGCILHQLLTGSTPFTADNFMAILSQHLTEPPTPIPDELLARSGAPPAINQVMLKALAKRRDDRFGSIEDMVAAIDACETGTFDAASASGPMPVQEAAVPTPAPRIESSGTRNRTEWTGRATLSGIPETANGSHHTAPVRSGSGGLWVILAALLLVGGGAAAFVLLGGSGDQSEVDPAPTQPAATRSTPEVSIDPAGDPARDPAGDPARDPAGDPAVAAKVAPDQVTPPAPTMVTIALATEPDGATVFDAEGETLGKTPLEFTVPRAEQTRRFRFELDGYHDYLLEISPTDDYSRPIALKPNADEAAVASSEVKAKPGKKSRRGKQRDKKPDEKDDKQPDPTSDPQLKNPFNK